MSQQNNSDKPDPIGDSQAGPEPADAGTPPPGADAALAGEAVIAGLEAQIKDLTDRLLRAHADMDNMRKRAEKERADTQKYAITKFAGDVISVADNLERAISAVPAAARENDAALKSLLDGVMMTERELANALGKHGIKRVDPKGDTFNPHLHQAVMEQPNSEVASGTVLQVFQAGYTIEDRVLRPAMVVVARGGPTAAKPQATDGETASRDGEPAAKTTGTADGSGFGKRTTPPGGNGHG